MQQVAQEASEEVQQVHSQVPHDPRAQVMTHTEQFLSETRHIAELIDSAQIEKMVGELKALRDRGGRLFLVGLGGSAANCSHAVSDFRRLCGIDAHTPLDSIPELTARANDEGWLTIFSGWISWMVPRAKDGLFVLSVGGGTAEVSVPIARAVNAAGVAGMRILGIVGRDGGYTKERGHEVVVIPTVSPERVTPHAEGWQLVILHCLVSHPDLQIRPTTW